MNSAQAYDEYLENLFIFQIAGNPMMYSDFVEFYNLFQGE